MTKEEMEKEIQRLRELLDVATTTAIEQQNHMDDLIKVASNKAEANAKVIDKLTALKLAFELLLNKFSV